MTTLGRLRSLADEALLSGNALEALRGYTALLRVQPRDLDARLRLADALLALGEVQPAAVVYTAFAKHAALSGYPLRALVAMKVLSALEPQLGRLLDSLARHYGKGSERLGRSARPSLMGLDGPLPEGFRLPDPEPREVLVQLAQQVGADVARIAVYPEKLPPIPLFSELPPDAFARVLHALRLVRARPGQAVVRQGEPGTSFFVVARGSVNVLREEEDGPRQLATLHDGAVFGEMAVLRGEPRGATVVAERDCDLLEFDQRALQAAAEQVETIGRALEAFARQRVLDNLLNTAPLFQPLERKQRHDLMRRFVATEVAEGGLVVREGQPGQGLYLVATGRVAVETGGVRLAELGPGDVFGEISLLYERPATADVRATTRTTVLFLARHYFQRLLEAVPAVRAYVEGLGDERLMDLRLSVPE